MKTAVDYAPYCTAAALILAAGLAGAGDRQTNWGTHGAAVTQDVEQAQRANSSPAQPADLEKQGLKITQQELQSGPAVADPGNPEAGSENPPWGGRAPAPQGRPPMMIGPGPYGRPPMMGPGPYGRPPMGPGPYGAPRPPYGAPQTPSAPQAQN